MMGLRQIIAGAALGLTLLSSVKCITGREYPNSHNETQTWMLKEFEKDEKANSHKFKDYPPQIHNVWDPVQKQSVSVVYKDINSDGVRDVNVCMFHAKPFLFYCIVDLHPFKDDHFAERITAAIDGKVSSQVPDSERSEANTAATLAYDFLKGFYECRKISCSRIKYDQIFKNRTYTYKEGKKLKDLVIKLEHKLRRRHHHNQQIIH